MNRIVPPSGITSLLTAFVAAAMAFLSVFALALWFATERLAARWASELAESATLRIAAPQAELDAELAAALRVLDQTPGVTSARALEVAEQRALLEPWFGPDLPLDDLPMPRLIEVTVDRGIFDAEGLALRLRAEVPTAVLDDHTRWRAPLITGAKRLQLVGWLAILLIVGALTAMITLAASASLAANARVIDVLRIIGARDRFVVRAFTRRFTLRALIGAAAGTVLGLIALAAVPQGASAGVLFADLRFRGPEWLAPLAIPLLAAAMAFLATRIAALRRLQETA